MKTDIRLLAFALCALSAANAAECVAPASGLVHWFSGDSTPDDLIGSSHGALMNGASYLDGKVAAAFTLDGVDDYVDLGFLPELKDAEGITVMAWINKADNANPYAAFVGKWNTSPCTQENTFLLYTGEGAGANKGTFNLNFNDDTCGSVTGATALPLAQWVHVAATWRSSDGQIVIYKNGTADGSATAGTGKKLKYHTAYTAKAGEWGVVRNSNYKFKGLLDEVAIFKRALTQAEIAAIFTADSAGMCKTGTHAAPAATTPYFTSFENGIGAEWGVAQVVSTYSAFTKFTGRFDNDPQTLRLKGLTPGKAYTLGFDFYAIDSWDGTSSPDQFLVNINGNQAFLETFSNYNGDPPSSPQSFASQPDGGRVNYGFSGYVDAIYRNVEIAFTPTGSTAVITFQGRNLQNVDDESWGLDNVSVRLSPASAQTIVRGTTLPENNSTNRTAIDRFTLLASGALASASATNAASYSLREAGANKTFGDGDDTVFTLSPSLTDTKTVGFRINTPPLQPGRYRFETKAVLLDTNNAAVALFSDEFAIANPIVGRIENTDNDSLPGATSLPSAETPAGTSFITAFGTGVFSQDHDVDYWRFEAEAGDLISIRVETDRVGVYPQLYLQTSAGENLITVGGSYEGIVQIQNYAAGKPGTYYIRVFTDYAQAPYRLRLDQSRGPQLETENNDSQNNANPLLLTTSAGTYQARVAGSLPAADTSGDYFLLGTLNVGNALNIQLMLPDGSSLAATNATLAVEVQGGAAPLVSSATGLLNFTVTTNGIHYIHIFSDQARDLRAQYFLNINVTDGVPPAVVSTTLPDEGATSKAIIDRFAVSFSEPLNPAFTILGRRILSRGGHTYLPTSDGMTWADAEAEAQTLGGHLVTINDAVENEWVRANFSDLGNVWIGLTDRDTEGAFVWTSAEPLTYTAWQGGEPNNSGGENFAGMFTSGAWNDFNGTAAYYGVIELSGADKDGDGLPDVADPYPNDRLNGFDLRAAGPDGVFSTADDQVYKVSCPTYASGLSALFYITDGPLQPGAYRFTVTTAVQDRAGNVIAAPFVRNFTVASLSGFVQEGRHDDSNWQSTSLSTSPTAAPDGTFTPVGYYSSGGANPYFVASGRFNADSHLDVVIANYSADNLGILVGNGDGTFQTPVSYVAGDGPIAVAVSDLNGDGKQDLVAVNHNSGNISILIGAGTGVFSSPTNYVVGTNPRSAVVADFNKDGKLDLAVANQTSDNISVLLGRGDGTFVDAVNYAAGNGSLNIATADLNADGKLDLATANLDEDTVSVLIGNGDGTFQAAVKYPVGDQPRGVAIGDLNGDSKPDLAVINHAANTISVLLNTGTGTFGAATDIAAGTSAPELIYLLDCNADGRLDVVIPSYGNNRLNILQGKGDGTFGDPVGYAMSGNPIALTSGDFNEDGRMDIVTADYGGNHLGVLLGNNVEPLAQDPAASGVRTGTGRGNLSSTSDYDYWSFTGNAGDAVVVAVDVPGNPGASQLYCRVDYPDGNRLTDFYTSYYGYGQSDYFTLPFTGTYTVLLRYNNQYFGEYRVRVTLAAPPTQIETEDNDAISRADMPVLALASGHQTATVLGYLSAGDSAGDFFGLGNLASGTTIALGLNKPATSGLSAIMSLYKADGTLMARSGASAPTLTFNVDAGAQSAYYAQITSAGAGLGASPQPALSFDGGNNNVSLGAWSPGNRWTVEAWVRPSSIPGGRRSIAGGYSENLDWGVTMYDSQYGVSIRIPGGSVQTLRSGETAVAGEWAHVAGTCDGTTARLYVNGVQKASGPVDTDYTGTTRGVLVGSEFCCGGNSFPGLIAEVRISNRALSAAEVLARMTTAPAPTADGLVGYWRLNEGSGSTVADLTAQGRNGTISGAAWITVGPSSATPPGLLSQYLLHIDLADTQAPTIVADTLPLEGTNAPVMFDRFSLSFSEDMLAGRVNDGASYELRCAGADGSFDTADDALYTVASQAYASGLSASYLVTDGPLQPGAYRFKARQALQDRAGNGLAADYVRRFVIVGVDGFVFEGRGNNSLATATTLSLNPTSTANGSFVAAGTSPTAGSTAHFIVASHFNADTHWDVAVANYSSDSVSVLRGNGDGTFQPTTNFTVGNGPISIAVGDLNKDGKSDLVVANHNAASISVLYGKGDGTFQVPVSYPVRNNPRSVAIGDFNGDSWPDVVVANQSSANVSVLLGAGDGTLLTQVNYPAGNGPHSVAVADLDGKNGVDLVVVNLNSDNISVLPGNGDGTFGAAVNYTVGNQPRSVAIGDLNGDGKRDLVVLNAGPNTVSVLMGKGDGTFEAQVSYPAGSSDPYHVLMADVQGNGTLDVVVASLGSQRVCVLPGNGDGTLGSPTAYSPGGHPIALALADFNEDGRLDIATANYYQNTVGLLLGNRTEMLALDPAGTGLRIGAARGNIFNNAEVDYWSFTGQAGDRLAVASQTPGNPGSSGLYYNILKPDGSQLGIFYAASSGWGQSSPLVLPVDGTYWIAVGFYHAYTGEYRLRVTLARPPVQLENEDNNNLNQVNTPELTLAGGHQTATVLGYAGVGDGSGDFFSLGNLANGATINLGLRQPASSGFADVLWIYNPSGTVVASSAEGGTNLSYAVPADAEGIYTVRVLADSVTPALRFDGIDGYSLGLSGNGYVTVNDAPSLRPASLTLEGWFNFSGTGGTRVLAAKTVGSASADSYVIWYQDDRLRAVVQNAGGSGSLVDYVWTPTLGVWYHIAFTFDDATKAEVLYVNGAQVATGTSSVTIGYDAHPLMIGAEIHYESPNYFFGGKADEVRLWNRVRTQAQLQADKSRRLLGNEEGLIGCWRLDEGSGLTTADLTANANRGTLVNWPAWISSSLTVNPASLLSQYLLDIDLADTQAPTIVADTLPLEGTNAPVMFDRFSLSFSEDMLAGRVNDGASYELRCAGADGSFDTADDALYTVASQAYASGLSASYLVTDGPLQPGAYRFKARQALQDRAGNGLAADYVRRFVIVGVDGFVFEGRGNNSLATATTLSLNPTSTANGSFVAAGTSPTAGSTAHFIVASHFNADTHWDVAVANYSSDSVSVLRGNGDGTFQPTTNFTVGNGPISIAVGDLNKDGKSDLVVANHNAASISVLYGKGDGTFQVPVSYPVRNNPRSVAIGDFNGDSWPDVVVANQSSANVSVLLGAGDGTLLTQVNYPAGNGPHSVAVADLDGKNGVDLVVVNLNSDNISVLPGNGDGTFGAAVNYTVGNQPRSVAIGDLNGDGKRDLVVLNAGPNTVSVLMGKGDGTFEAQVSYPAGSSDPYHVLMADVQGNGTLDVVVASLGSQRVCVLPGNGDGTLGSPTAYSPGGHPIALALADFNEDGRLDIATANYYQNTVGLLLGNRTEMLALDPAGTGLRIGAARGNIFNNAEVDYWSFTGQAGDRLAVASQTPGNPGSSGLYYNILKPDGSQLGIFYAASSGWGQSSPLVLPVDGTYWIAVGFYHAYTGEYRLRVTLARPPVQLENEDNNNLNQVNTPELTLAGGHQTATVLGYAGVGDGSGDFFSLGNLANGATINLGLRQPASSGFADVLWIYNPSGTVVASSAEGGTNLSYAVPADAEGIYTVRVLADSVTPALRFDGIDGYSLGLSGNGYVTVNDAPSLRPASLTLEGWFNFSGTGGTRVLAAKTVGSASADSYVIWYQDDRLRAVVQNAGGSGSLVDYVWTPTLGVWYHIAFTFDDATKAEVLYVNGAQVATGTSSVTIGYDAHPLMIGAEIHYESPNYFFGGKADEVRLWNRVRTQAQLQADKSRRLLGNEEGLIGCWRLDEGSGLTTADLTANANRGTLVNWPAWISSSLTVNPASLLSQYLLDVDLTSPLPPAIVADSLPNQDATSEVVLDRFSLTFSEDMLAESVNSAASYDLRTAGTDGAFDTADDGVYTIDCQNYATGLAASYFIADGPLQPGAYRFIARSSIQSRFGKALIPSYERRFTISRFDGYIVEGRSNDTLENATLLPLVGDLLQAASARGNVSGSSDVDYWTFTGNAKDRLLLAIETPGSPANSSLLFRVRKPDGAVLTEFTTANRGWGQSSAIELPTSGIYSVEVRFNNQYTGEYRFKVVMATPPMSVEQEDNGSIAGATALPLAPSGTAQVGSAMGYIRFNGDLDYFNLGTLTNGSTVFINARLPVGSDLAPVVSLYDASNGYLVEAGSGRPFDGVSEVRITQTGTYYAVVRGASGGGGLDAFYILDAQVVPTGSVLFPNLQVTDITLPTGSEILSGQSVTFSFNVKNVGSAATPTGDWTDRVVLSANTILGDADDVQLGIYAHSGALDSAAGYLVTRSATLPEGIDGDFHLIVQTDYGNAISEFLLEGDNVTPSEGTFHVTRKAYPDLVVEDLAVSGPDAAKNYTLQWKTANRGAAAVGVAFKERLVVKNLTTGATLLSQDRDVTGGIAVAATKAQSATVNATEYGNYQVLVTTDFQNAIYEFNAVSHESAEQNTAQASFRIAKTFLVSVQSNPAGAGTVGGGGTFAEGTGVTVTAAPITTTLPYRFQDWTENGAFQSATPDYTFTLTRERRLVANFTLPTFRITASNSPPAGGTLTGAGTYAYDSTASLTASPSYGYRFANWTEGTNVLGTNTTLALQARADRSVVAHYTEAHLYHDVTTATLPAGLATFTGVGRYNNGQTATITAPASVTQEPNLYTFKRFTLNGAFFGDQRSFSKTFATTDSTNMAFIAEYDSRSIRPVIISARGSIADPVPATANYILTLQFDRSMKTAPAPLVVITNARPGSTQPTVPTGGTWSMTLLPNDTYRTPAISFATGMDGTNRVFVSLAQDTNSNVLTQTNAIDVVVDVTPPTITAVAATGRPSSAIVTWTTDEPATSQVEFGSTTSYGSSTALDSQLVTAHRVVVNGLTPESPYHYRVRSRDHAGNERLSADATVTTIAAPDLQVGTLTVEPATGLTSGVSGLLRWTDRNSGRGPVTGSWYERVVVSNLTSNLKLVDRLVFVDTGVIGEIASTGTKDRTEAFRLPDGPDGAGTILFVVTLDYYDTVFEQNTTGTAESNNTAGLNRVATLAVYPDLQVSNLTITPSAPTSGADVTVAWGDTNAGSASVSVSFRDRLVVRNLTSGETFVNTTLFYDATAGDPGPIAPNKSKPRQFVFRLPDGARGAGTLQAEVTTDIENAVFELNGSGNAESNNSASRNATSTVAPYPDLTITRIDAPATGISGQPVEISYVIANIGTAPATGPWTDQVFVSDDDAIGGDVLAGSFSFTGAIAAGQSLTNKVTITLPEYGAGDRRIVVKADASNNVFEQNEANNSAISAQPVSVPAVLTFSWTRNEFPENAGSTAATAAVTRNTSTQNSLEVQLSSSDITAVTVPATVTIPAGRASVSFPISAVDDTLVDGPQTATVTARAAGFSDIAAAFTATDDDVPTLVVETPITLAENGAPANATVTRNTPATNALTVVLISSDNRHLKVSGSLTIPLGQRTATFQITPVDNAVPNNTTRVTISANAAGYYTVPAVVDVVDDDLPTLVVTLTEPVVSEGAVNPATRALITRTPVSAQAITLAIGSSDPNVATVAIRATIPAGEASVLVPVGVVNNAQVDGEKQAEISATVIDETTQAAITRSTAKATLRVADDDGPTLTVTLASELVSESGTTTGTVTRNTGTAGATLVTLASSDTTEATVQPTVTIPNGQISATFTIRGVADGQADGVQRASITASAVGFTSGQASLNVSDIDLPDLRVTRIVVPPSGVTAKSVTVSWNVINNGLSTANGPWSDRLFLSTSPDGSGAEPLAQFLRAGNLAVGEQYERTAAVLLPSTPGDYYLIVAADAFDAVHEGSELNNTAVSGDTMSIAPAYRATVQTDVNAALSGTRIPMHGTAFKSDTHEPAPNALVSVRVTVKGTRRVINARSDASGNFDAVFDPLPGEAGHYTICADHPGVATDTVQDQFDLLGMRFTASVPSYSMTPGQSVTGEITLQNLSEVPLNGFSAVLLPDVSAFVSLSIELTNKLAGSTSEKMGFTLKAAEVDSAVRGSFTLRVTSNEGAAADLAFNVSIAPLTPQLVATPSALSSGMNRGHQTFVEFDVVNKGGVASGEIEVRLPDVKWLALASPSVIASLAPGESNRVVLVLNPPADLPLARYDGNLLLSARHASTSIPFYFRAISEAVGDLSVEVLDDFTYYAEGAPKVADALVTLTDAISGDVVASGTTDTTGTILLTNIMEGKYQMTVSAQQHSIYRNPVSIVPGITNEASVFIDRQTVSYRWSVVPTQIEDHYRVVLESVFETEVPIPVVTVENPFMMPLIVAGEDTQLEVRVTNHGLIAAELVQLEVPYHENYEIVPLIDVINSLPAKTSMSIPFIIRARAQKTAGLQSVGKHDGGDFGCGKTFTGCSALPKLKIKWSYVCGPDRRWHANETQIIPVCVEHDCWEAIKDKFKDLIKALIDAGGNPKELLSWRERLCDLAGVIGQCLGDDCLVTIIGMVCGVATLDPVGAISAALKFGNCWCPSLPSLGGSGPGGGSSGPGGFGGSGPSGGGGPGVVEAPVYWDYSPDCRPGDTFGGEHEVAFGYRNVPIYPVINGKSVKLASGAQTAGLQSAGGVCARVRMRIEQEAVITRAAFLGTLEIENGHADSSLTDIQVSLDIRDEQQNPANDKFGVRGPVLSGLTAVDGTGVIAASATGSARFTFIPTHEAAPEKATLYRIGGTLKYREGANLVEVPLMPDTITVFPDPVLHLLYFQQRDVYGDDPFTDVIEPSEPFVLGLMVKNSGKGAAIDFKITSAQPKIVENEKGLLIDFKIINSQVGAEAKTPSLTLNLGRIDPGTNAIGYWSLISTLQGKFLEYTATFEHIDAIGEKHLSLIDSVEIHELIHAVKTDRPGDDEIPDFLVNDQRDVDNLPDTLYLSDGSVAPVALATAGTVDNSVSLDHMQVHLTATMSEGWNYLKMPDPGVGFRLARVLRSDGKALRLEDNVWTTDRTFPSSQAGAVREYRLHMLDFNGTGSYTLYYRVNDSVAPSIVDIADIVPATQTGPVSTADLTFSEPIDLSTFGYEDITLSLNGGTNLVGSGVTVAHLSGNTYRINGLQTMSGLDGNYELTVVGAGIEDYGGNAVENTESVRWAKGTAAPVVVSIANTVPKLRNVPVPSVDVTLSKAIDASTFNFSDVTLTRNGGPNLVNSGISVTPVSATVFRISGLGGLNATEGDYVLTVNATGIKDTGGAAGINSLSASWTVDTTGPTVASVETVSTNPRNIVVPTLDVVFSEPINPDTFDYRDVTLTRDGGANLITGAVLVAKVDALTYRISNFTWVSGEQGNYILTVNATGIADPAGNAGTGSAFTSWVMDTSKPTEPTHLAITPDLGVSSTDGLTSSTNLTLSGWLPRTNLTVKLYDDTMKEDLGYPIVKGTNFTKALTFATGGAHRLHAQSVDEAGNFSAYAYFDVFMDLVGPSAEWQAVSPDPRTESVASVVITFTEPIDETTLTRTDLVLTRNSGANLVGAGVTIQSLGGNAYRIGGLSALTSEPGTYQLGLNLTGVQDRAGNPGADTALETWVFKPSNAPPILTAIADASVPPGVLLTFTNRVTDVDVPTNKMTFTLAAGAPAGATVGSTSGIFAWRPSQAQAHTTNHITVIVTDDGSPTMSDSKTFTVVVEDFLELAIGSGVVHIGEDGSVPLQLTASSPVVDLTFLLDVPTNRLGNLALQNLAPEIASFAVQYTAQGVVIAVNTQPGQALSGAGKHIADLRFTAATNQTSAFVPLRVAAIDAAADTFEITNKSARPGRVVVVGKAPLLEAMENGDARRLILYGEVGARCAVQSTLRLETPITWQAWQEVTLTSLFQVWDNVGPVNGALYFRAFRR